MKEYKGKKNLIYENGKKTNCEYNRFNENFIISCYDRYKTIIRMYKDLFPELLEMLIKVFNILTLIFTTFVPIIIPFLVYFDKKNIKEMAERSGTLDQLYKWKI